MSGLRILLLLPVTFALFGQTEQNAVPNPGEVIDRAVRGVGKGALGLARPMLQFGLNRPVSLSGAAPECSVPLREMKIPDDKNFTLKELKPPQDFIDHMLAAPVMPACASATK
jgi:hypothetical protein